MVFSKREAPRELNGLVLSRGSCTNNHLSLVIWGTNLTSTVGRGRFTKQENNMIKLAPKPKSIIIGLLLSDGWLTFASKRSNYARLGFAQGGNNSKYLFFVFFQLSHYCSSNPLVRIRTYRGKENIGLQFFTRALPSITELHPLFYPKGEKVIPSNIYQLLTPVALAHLIMGDGSAWAYTLIICTDSYTIPDAVRLMNVLIVRYELDCSLRFYRPNQPRIHIKQKSMPKLRAIVIPFMCESMMYKLEGGQAKYNVKTLT